MNVDLTTHGKEPSSIRARLCDPFLVGDRINPWLVTLFCLINVIVFYNAMMHHPTVGYDAFGHLEWVERLSEGSFSDGHEFFCPPLPYLPGGIFKAVTGWPVPYAAKMCQLAHVILSLLLVWYLLAMAKRVPDPGGSIRLYTLLLLGMMCVYYKGFSLVRGEAWVAAFGVMAGYYLIQAFWSGEARLRPALAGGICLGIAINGKQWGMMLVGAGLVLMAWAVLVRTGERRRCLAAAGLAVLAVFCTGAWFYIYLQYTYGSWLAFNNPTSFQSILETPPSFLFSTGGASLFTEPVRPAFPRQAAPIFYSGIWGDYWGYFLMPRWLTEEGHFFVSPRQPYLGTITPAYLGRANLVGLLPSLVMLAGFFWGVFEGLRTLRKKSLPQNPILVWAALAILLSAAGYLWFALSIYVRMVIGEQIKAAYMLQVFPYFALLGGMLLARLTQGRRSLHRIVVVVLLLAFLHQVPTLLTRRSNARVFWGGVIELLSR